MLGLYFVVGRERLTVPVSFVVEVLPAVELDPAGASPPGVVVLGLLRHRGQVVPLVDPTGQGSEWESRLSRRIIVVQAHAAGDDRPRRIGLAADRVFDLRPIVLEGRAYAPATALSDVRAAYADEEGIVHLIDVNALVRCVFIGEAG